MKALSLDLRRRIVATYEQGDATQAEVAQRFSVGPATVERLVRRKRETGSLEPRPHGGGQAPRLTEADRALLLGWFREEPDLTQQEVAQRLSAQGRPVSQPTVGRALRRLGITRKKRP